jgi:tetratricopeptide (TPR) repeat protein
MDARDVRARLESLRQLLVDVASIGDSLPPGSDLMARAAKGVKDVEMVAEECTGAKLATVALDEDATASAKAQELKDRAADMFKAKKFAAALKFCDEAIALQPREATHRANRSLALLRLGRPADAAAAAEDAAACRPAWAKAHYRLGVALQAKAAAAAAAAAASASPAEERQDMRRLQDLRLAARALARAAELQETDLFENPPNEAANAATRKVIADVTVAIRQLESEVEGGGGNVDQEETAGTTTQVERAEKRVAEQVEIQPREAAARIGAETIHEKKEKGDAEDEETLMTTATKEVETRKAAATLLEEAKAFEEARATAKGAKERQEGQINAKNHEEASKASTLPLPPSRSRSSGENCNEPVCMSPDGSFDIAAMEAAKAPALGVPMTPGNIVPAIQECLRRAACAANDPNSNKAGLTDEYVRARFHGLDPQFAGIAQNLMASAIQVRYERVKSRP